MPNKPREFEIGGIYHIIKRGVDGRKIFLNNQDRSRFILGLEFFNNEDSSHLWNLVRGDNTERTQSSLSAELNFATENLYSGKMVKNQRP